LELSSAGYSTIKSETNYLETENATLRRFIQKYKWKVKKWYPFRFSLLGSIGHFSFRQFFLSIGEVLTIASRGNDPIHILMEHSELGDFLTCNQ
jgi:hypothetical protein